MDGSRREYFHDAPLHFINSIVCFLPPQKSVAWCKLMRHVSQWRQATAPRPRPPVSLELSDLGDTEGARGGDNGGNVWWPSRHAPAVNLHRSPQCRDLVNGTRRVEGGMGESGGRGIAEFRSL